jgi:hypothetical protein
MIGGVIVPAEFNIPDYFAERGMTWDAVQQQLGWPKGGRRHALKRFVEGAGRLSRDEINDLLRYVHDHAPNWMDYLLSANVLELMTSTGRVRMYLVAGPEGDTGQDYSSMFDLLALAYVNSHLPRTTWRPVQCEIEPCRTARAVSGDGRTIVTIDRTDPAEWKISFGSSKVSRPTTLLLERIFGGAAVQPPEAEPVVFRFWAPPDVHLQESRFVDRVADADHQGVSIRGGKAFQYVPIGRDDSGRGGTDIGLIVCQADRAGRGGRVVIAGVSGPGTYAAAIAFVQRADLFAPGRVWSTAAPRPDQPRYDSQPRIGVVEARVEQEEGAPATRVVVEARLVYCSANSKISRESPIPLTIPG